MKLIVLLSIIIGIGVLPASAQKVKVGSDPGVDVSRYRTYAWSQPMQLANPLIQQVAVDAVEAAMTAKGLKKVDSQPELMLIIWTAVDSDMHIAYPSWSNAMGTGISTGIAVGSQAWPVSKGTLVVDMEDAATKSSVWRGTAVHTLDHGPTGNSAKDAKIVVKPIQKAIDKMFKQFPRPK
jgi:hypothetical protein